MGRFRSHARLDTAADTGSVVKLIRADGDELMGVLDRQRGTLIGLAVGYAPLGAA